MHASGANIKRGFIDIDLYALAVALLKWSWLIVLVAVLTGSVVYGCARVLITPTYRSSFTAYVNNKSSQDTRVTLSNSDLTASQSLVNTYATIISSRYLIESAIEEAGLNYSYEDVQDAVLTETMDDTEIIEVSVTMTNAVEAALLAQAISSIAPDYLSQVVEGSSMNIVDLAVVPNKPYDPNYLKLTMWGVIIGGLFTVMCIILRNTTDNRVKDPDSVSARYNLTIVGIVPNWNEAQKFENKNVKNNKLIEYRNRYINSSYSLSALANEKGEKECEVEIQEGLKNSIVNSKI